MGKREDFERYLRARIDGSASKQIVDVGKGYKVIRAGHRGYEVKPNGKFVCWAYVYDHPGFIGPHGELSICPGTIYSNGRGGFVLRRDRRDERISRTMMGNNLIVVDRERAGIDW